VSHRLARYGTGKNTAADGSLTPSTLRLSSRPRHAARPGPTRPRERDRAAGGRERTAANQASQGE